LTAAGSRPLDGLGLLLAAREKNSQGYSDEYQRRTSPDNWPNHPHAPKLPISLPVFGSTR
jgi:hypothetical protein